MRGPIPEGDLYLALKWIRDLRAACIAASIDPRATRVALKFALLVDDYHSGKKLTLEEDRDLTRRAEDYFRRAKKGFERSHV